MNQLTVKSPAKVNLYLKVRCKRPDGFHDIITLFERVNLCDDMTFRSRQDGKIRILCSHPQVPKGPKNLVYKVARVLRNDFSIKEGVEIYIKKRIPVAAGLAGGSSNAATALLGLAKLWKLTISHKKLFSYASQIGSDVAFFLYQSSWALGTERGDKIKKININNKLWHILVVPKIKLLAGKVYGGLKLKLTNKKDDVSILIRNLRKNDMSAVGPLLVNDLEDVVLAMCPQLLRLKQKMRSLGAYGVMVSGSGPCVYGLTRTKAAAQKIRQILVKNYAQVFVVETL